MSVFKTCGISAFILILPLAGFTKTTTSKNFQNSVVGAYADMEVDTGSMHYFTPTGGYCFMLSAGSLDLNFGGKWTAKLAENGSQNIEIKLESALKTMFPVWLNRNKQQDKNVLTINGHRFSEVNFDVMLGFGNSPEAPEKFGALFKTDEQATMSNYTVAIPDNMKYMFVGYQTNEGNYILERYELPKKIDKLFYLSFDFNAYYVKKLGRLHANYKNDELKFINENGNLAEPLQRQSLTKKQFEEVETQCVQPMLKGDVSSLFDEPSQLLMLTTVIWQGKPTLDSWHKVEQKK